MRLSQTCLLVGFVVSTALSGCQQTHPSGPTTPARPRESRWSHLSRSSSCDEIVKRFRDRLAAATNTCKTAADCGCHNPVDPATGCGGVVDQETAAQLSSIESEFHKSACTWQVQCAPRRCQPSCVQGHCT